MRWGHSQVVRQWTANPRFPGSNPGGTSKRKILFQANRIFFVMIGKICFHFVYKLIFSFGRNHSIMN